MGLKISGSTKKKLKMLHTTFHIKTTDCNNRCKLIKIKILINFEYYSTTLINQN